MYNYPPTASSVGAVTFAGLPVVGFAVEAFRPSLSSWYDGVFDHKWQSQDYGYFTKRRQVTGWVSSGGRPR